MPVTLDDLLEKERNGSDTFPATHEEFVAMQEKKRAEMQSQPSSRGYSEYRERDIVRPSLFPIGDNSARTYDNVRAYENRPHLFDEPTRQEYDQYASGSQMQAPMLDPRRPDDDQYENDARMQEPMQEQRQSSSRFYEFVARDNSRQSEEELRKKLSYTNEHGRPLFDRSGNAMNENAFARQALADTADNRHRVRSRLNTAGKLIVGSFVATVVVAVSLIFAFGSKINSGTAVVPASSVVATVNEAIQ